MLAPDVRQMCAKSAKGNLAVAFCRHASRMIRVGELLACAGLGVALLELVDPSSRIHDLVLAGVERV